MTRSFWLCLLLSGCASFSLMSTPQVTPGNPGLLGPTPADPGRPPRQLPGRACVLECGVGHHCNEETAKCEPDLGPPRPDAGVPWLP